MFHNRYFEFDEPIHWFRKIGHSASNTYVGSSRAIDTVHERSTVEPADQVHALVGGTFLVRSDGTVEEGCFRLKKHIFEKAYGPLESDAAFLSKVAATGRCRELGRDRAAKADYAAPRIALDGKPALPALMGQLAGGEADPSPLTRQLLDAAQDGGLMQAAAEAGHRLGYREVGHEPESTECCLEVSLNEGKTLQVVADPRTRDIWIRDRTLKFAHALRSATPGALGLDAEFRNEAVTIFRAPSLDGVIEAVAGFVRDGWIAAPPAVGASGTRDREQEATQVREEEYTIRDLADDSGFTVSAMGEEIARFTGRPLDNPAFLAMARGLMENPGISVFHENTAIYLVHGDGKANEEVEAAIADLIASGPVPRTI